MNQDAFLFDSLVYTMKPRLPGEGYTGESILDHCQTFAGMPIFKKNFLIQNPTYIIYVDNIYPVKKKIIF